MNNIYLSATFEEQRELCDAVYLIINDVNEFINDAAKQTIFNDGVFENGFYTWSDDDCMWEIVLEKDIVSTLTQIQKENGKKDKGDNSTPQFVGWNIIITLDTGEIIKTNSELIDDFNEVVEAMNIMLKPSFFGKRIKSFEIVAE